MLANKASLLCAIFWLARGLVEKVAKPQSGVSNNR